MEIQCKSCGDVLNVGEEKRTTIVLCMAQKKIVSCSNEQWGSANTRFPCASKDGIQRHVVQTDPPDPQDSHSYELGKLPKLAEPGGY